jgi:23S rRNA pseudouridine2605 synthase
MASSSDRHNPHTSTDRPGTRINKYIAHAGVCSRRDADQLVEQGRVKVDGEVVTEHGTRVMSGQTVEVDGKNISPKQKAYILLNKPKDTISTTDDEKDRRTVLDVVGAGQRNPKGLFPVGRLDRNTVGVMLITNDGDLAHRLMHPRFEVDKIYFVRTQDPVKPHQIDALRRGVDLEDGPAQADDVAYVDPSNQKEVLIKLHEGRNRQIRRMMERLGHTIVLLERVEYAGLTAGDLPRGHYRSLHNQEVNALRKRVQLN